jgi:hypothetical protein
MDYDALGWDHLPDRWITNVCLDGSLDSRFGINGNDLHTLLP